MNSPVVGQTYGRLIAVQPMCRRTPRGYPVWEWDCVCGNRLFRTARTVLHGDPERARQCVACYFRENRKAHV